MVRIAAINDDLSTRVEDAVHLAGAAGLDGLALRHLDGVPVDDVEPGELRRVRSLFEAHGLAVVALSSRIGRDCPVDADPSGVLSHLDRIIARCELVGTDLIRVFGPWLSGQDAVATWWRRPAPVVDQVVAWFSPLAERAVAAGMRLMIELEGASHIGQVAEAAAVLEALGSPALSLCWDVCNGWWSGEDPVPVGLTKALTLPLSDVQFKDVRALPGHPGRPADTLVDLGAGDVDYPSIVTALVAENYQGWCTVERVHHPRRPEAESPLQQATLRDIVHLKELLR